MIPTRTDRGATEWRINDDVVRLREWGTGIIHRLPQPPWDSAVIGTAETCSLQVVDPSGYTSREHARLERSTMGCSARGEPPHHTAQLHPGPLGWAPDKMTTVAPALRAIWLAGMRARCWSYAAPAIWPRPVRPPDGDGLLSPVIRCA